MNRYFLVPKPDDIDFEKASAFFGTMNIGSIGDEITRSQARDMMLADRPETPSHVLDLFLSSGGYCLKDGRTIRVV